MKKLLQFIETSLFSKQIVDILNSPEIGDIIQGTGGVRKVR